MKIHTLKILILFSVVQFFSLNTASEPYNIAASIHFNDEELDLVGEGIRRDFLFDVYQVGFYSDVKDINKLIHEVNAFPLTIRIKILTGMLPDDPPSYWVTLFSRVLNDEQFDIFTHHYSMLEEGDILAINYQPETGSSIYMKGERLIKIEGTDFINSVVDGFIGPDPVSVDLKSSILEAD